MHGGDRCCGENPHGEQGEPAEELDHGQATHGFRHPEDIVDDFCQAIGRPHLVHKADNNLYQAEAGKEAGKDIEFLLEPCDPHAIESGRTGHQPHEPAEQIAIGRTGRRLAVVGSVGGEGRGAGGFEGIDLFGAVLARRDDGPEHGEKHAGGTDVERQLDRVRCQPLGCRRDDGKHIGQNPGQAGGQHGTCADEEGLHGIAAGALFIGKIVSDEGTEGLHGDVDRSVHDPQGRRRQPQAGSIGHVDHGCRCQDRADQEIGPPSPQPPPGLVAEMPDDRLDQQPGQGRGDPQDREIVDLGTEGLEDPADIAVLEGKADLDTEESDAHVPDGELAQAGSNPAGHARLLGGCGHVRRPLPIGTKRMA